MIGSGRHPQRNIVLTGFHAAGKTSVARVLSRRMRRPVVDCGAELKRRARRSLRVLLPIGAAPASEAESAGSFLQDFTFRRDCILDLDVATALSCDVCGLLGDFSYLVFLDPPFDELLSRVDRDHTYAELRTRLGDAELLAQWLELRSRLEGCDLQLSSSAGVQRSSLYILHSFYT